MKKIVCYSFILTFLLFSCKTKKEMKKVLTEIQDGTFARNWILENQSNRAGFSATRRRESRHQIEQVGAELRSMMSWIKK